MACDIRSSKPVWANERTVHLYNRVYLLVGGAGLGIWVRGSNEEYCT